MSRIGVAAAVPATRRPVGPHYKWIALSNTTLGILMATINASIVLIALPDIFRGIHLNPLTPGNTPYFLWLLMGYMVVTAVLVVTLGRIGDIFGRVRMYNLGFLVFTAFSIMLSLTWMTGPDAALYLIGMRVLQGVGAALLWANSAAILTDAFPSNQRGMALGTNMVAAIAGSFIGLVLGGVLGPIAWQLVFLVSVPVGLFGTVWAYFMLRDTGVRQPARIDWWGNVTFAIGLVALLVGITYGILPYGTASMGWSNPLVLLGLFGGVAFLGLFTFIETRVADPMFRINLFKIRAFAAGNVAALLSALARGGLMFILIIWLQGIWLPQHGFSFAQTPLWAGIYMLPLTAGFLIAGPIAGILSDRHGSRIYATIGVSVSAVVFILFQVLPANFNYVWFAALLALYGLSSGLFASPNQAGIMNSLPPNQRGAGAGMSATFQNSAQVLSIGIFFTLIIVGLSASLPHTLYHGLVVEGVPAVTATRISHLPAVGSLFASFLGFNPIASLLGPTLTHLSPAHQAYLTGRAFFPHLISGPFLSGLHAAFDFAFAACALAAVASWMRGGKYVHQEVLPVAPGLAPALATAQRLSPQASAGAVSRVSPVAETPGRASEAEATRRGQPGRASTP
ncbi:MAG: MFS transporter [Candidatus Dormiibacterota bacterium]|jgi:MFS family permease